jgi:hypothetical protein
MSTVRTGLSAAWLPMQFGEDQVFQEFGFDFMTPIACTKSVNLMSPLGVVEYVTSGSATRL